MLKNIMIEWLTGHAVDAPRPVSLAYNQQRMNRAKRQRALRMLGAKWVLFRDRAAKWPTTSHEQ